MRAPTPTVAALAALLLLAPGGPSATVAHAAGASRAGAVEYQAPVAAPVGDPFRPPSTPYGPGNRGLEYETGPGDVVHAAAGGTVTFAGQVGGDRYVTVLHADRARTTYGPLGEVAVTEGDGVGPGDPVGTAAGPALLWTVRLGDAYLDPAVVLAASGNGGVRLVPVREGLGGG